MIRKTLLALAFGLTVSCAQAQTAPSPADVGISKGTPDVFKLKGSDNAWTPFGSVDPSTHIFIPGTNGNIAPNDCVKWGPGLTSAGAACNSVTGGAHPANQLTIYTNHAGLVANVTTPTEAWTVQQQGFYAPGDGGDISYQWDFTSYCAGGTSGAPVAADGIICVLPIGQSASTAGRYLISTIGTVNVRQIGMKPGGFDNSPLVQTLMNAIGPPTVYGSGAETVFPATPGKTDAYYFSQPIDKSRPGRINCNSSSNLGPVILMFAPGVHGIIQDQGYVSPDGGWGGGDINGCALESLGGGSGNSADGSNVITDVAMNTDVHPVPGDFVWPTDCHPVGTSCTFGVGDGVFAIAGYHPLNSGLAVAPGAYVSASDTVASTITLASPYVIGNLGYPAVIQVALWDLPVKQKYTVKTTIGSHAITVTNGPRLLHPGDMIWSDAFPFGATVYDTNNAIVGTPTVNTGGSGYAGTSGTMTWSGLGCVGSFNRAPVLNVTASGGVITGVTSVADAGQCIQSSPSSTATTWTPGGGLSGGSGASFHMVFNQISNIVDLTMYAYTNATKTETAGQLWVLPEGIARRAGGETHNTYINYFVYDLSLDCMTGLTPPTGCNDSLDTRDGFSRALVGRLARGNTSGASLALANVYAQNYFSDVVEMGTIGSNYIGEGYNSAEDATSNYDMLVGCGAQNYSVWYGQYMSGQPAETCLGLDANGNAAIGVPAVTGNGTSAPLVIGSVYGGVIPSISSGRINGPWIFGFPNGENVIADTATASGTVIEVPSVQPYWFAGLGVTDLTHPVIPDGTTIKTLLDGNHLELSNALTGGGIQVGDKLQIVGGGCINISGGINTHYDFDKSCSNFLTQSFSYSGFYQTWGFNSRMYLTNYDYFGYKTGAGAGDQHGVVFPNGASFGDSTEYAGTERLLDSGPQPSPETWHLQGDVRLNSTPDIGGNAAWTNVSIFQTTLAGSVTSGTTTSVQVAACPSPSAPVGVSISHISPGQVRAIQLDVNLGTLASCLGTTLTFQAAAINSGANGDIIRFLEWLPTARIANDPAGSSYLPATPQYIANLAACSLTTVGLGIAWDGQDAATAGYNAPVSATGATHRLVFCDGTSWTYH